jgi:hypothetical protein
MSEETTTESVSEFRPENRPQEFEGEGVVERGRRLFAEAELRAFAAPSDEVATFDASGRIAWRSGEAPASLPGMGRMYVAPEKMASLTDEAVVDAKGAVRFEPSAAAPPDVDPRALRWLEKWAALSVEDREPFVARAGRNMPEWDHKASLEYGAYCLFVRGRMYPLSRPAFRALSARLKATSKKRRQRGSREPVVPPKTGGR